MTARSTCLRCGSAKLLPAHMEQPTAFCVDHAAHRGVLHVSLKASLCERCGHIEFWLPGPDVLSAPQNDPPAVLQEEDF